MKSGRSFRSSHQRGPALHWCLRCRLQESSIEIPPVAAVALHQLVGLFRSPASAGIIRKITWWQRLPYIQNRADYAPASFEHVTALEQCSIADHAVVQQALVTGAGLSAEIISVIEIHVHRTQSHDLAGNFRGKLK